MDILKSRHLLRKYRNNRGEKYFIKENLTLQRRLLCEKAREELTSYQHHWVKNGSIFVRKSSDSRPIKVHSQECLEKLISAQNGTPIGIPTNYRTAFVNALKLQKVHNEQFNFERVDPILHDFSPNFNESRPLQLNCLAQFPFLSTDLEATAI